MVSPTFKHLLSYEEVNKFSTEEIISKLRDLGISFEKEDFLRAIEMFYSAEEVSENYFNHFKVKAPGRMEDFPWFATWILWERLAPPENLSLEQLSNRIEDGYDALDNNDPIKASDEWLEVWDYLQYRINPLFKRLDYLDEYYRESFFIRNVVQDLELTLDQAGQKDPSYYEKRISFCRSFCHLFQGEELIYHNMRRAIAESYSKLGQYDQAETEFQQLIADVPANPWGYIGLADLLFLDKNQEYSQAESLYKKALELSGTHPYSDKEAVEDRLAGLKREQEKQ